MTMTQAVTIADKDGPLGTITLDGDRLTGSTPVLQRIADQRRARAASAQAAFGELVTLRNGYLWAVTPGA